MAVNLASKYSAEVAERFSKASLTENFISKDFNFNGVRGITVYSVDTAPLGDYTRSGTNRYGTPGSLSDTTQELVMTQDKAFTYIIDKGDDNEQMNVKGAAKSLKREIDEVISPYLDQYRLKTWAEKAGKIAGIAAATKDTIVDAIMQLTTALDDALVPETGRTLFISSSNYRLLKQSPEFISQDKLSEDVLAHGVVGSIDGMKVVKVPTSLMPQYVRWLAVHQSAVLGAAKLQDYKIHTDPPGINGNLVEGRLLHDAFVLAAKSNGVYAAVETARVCATPIVSLTSGTVTMMSTTSDSKIYYTLDGSDPRYSDTKALYTTGLTSTQLAGVTVVKAHTEKVAMFNSGVGQLSL
jgi:sulfur transfer complex TusBCD TusB component (DsrH family)